eukprot:g2154.t1
MSSDDRKWYEKQFLSIEPKDKDGKVCGKSAVRFFARSGLDCDALAKVWDLADLDGDKHLDKEEFCLAMHLCVLAKNMGFEIPDEIPSVLIPSSKRKSLNLKREKLWSELRTNQSNSKSQTFPQHCLQLDRSRTKGGFSWDTASNMWYNPNSKYFFDEPTGLYSRSPFGPCYRYDKASRQLIQCNEMPESMKIRRAAFSNNNGNSATKKRVEPTLGLTKIEFQRLNDWRQQMNRTELQINSERKYRNAELDTHEIPQLLCSKKERRQPRAKVWIKRELPSYGRNESDYYYENTITGETRHEAPREFVEESAETEREIPYTGVALDFDNMDESVAELLLLPSVNLSSEVAADELENMVLYSNDDKCLCRLQTLLRCMRKLGTDEEWWEAVCSKNGELVRFLCKYWCEHCSPDIREVVCRLLLACAHFAGGEDIASWVLVENGPSLIWSQIFTGLMELTELSSERSNTSLKRWASLSLYFASPVLAVELNDGISLPNRANINTPGKKASNVFCALMRTALTGGEQAAERASTAALKLSGLVSPSRLEVLASSPNFDKIGTQENMFVSAFIADGKSDLSDPPQAIIFSALVPTFARECTASIRASEDGSAEEAFNSEAVLVCALATACDILGCNAGYNIEALYASDIRVYIEVAIRGILDVTPTAGACAVTLPLLLHGLLIVVSYGDKWGWNSHRREEMIAAATSLRNKRFHGEEGRYVSSLCFKLQKLLGCDVAPSPPRPVRKEAQNMEMFSTEMKQLISMGFTNTDANALALLETKNDVYAAVAKLSESNNEENQKEEEASLQKLISMGFTNMSQNRKALRETNNNVPAAIEYLISNME